MSSPSGEEEGEEREEYEVEDLSAELLELKRRIGGVEQNIASLSNALKNTLTDIRTIISELDNPFNILRSVGVDQLLEKCIEHVKEEVNSLKREELKRRLVKDEEPKQNGQTIIVNPSATVKEGLSCCGSPDGAVCSLSSASTTTGGEVSHGGECKSRSVSLPLISDGGFNGSTTGFNHSGNGFSSIHRTAYLMLAAGYLLLKVGYRKADFILTEYVKRGCVSPEIARDVADMVYLLGGETWPTGESSTMDAEDHILLINYLRSLENMVSDGKSSNLFFTLFFSKAVSYMLKLLHVSRSGRVEDCKMNRMANAP